MISDEHLNAMVDLNHKQIQRTPFGDDNQYSIVTVWLHITVWCFTNVELPLAWVFRWCICMYTSSALDVKNFLPSPLERGWLGDVTNAMKSGHLAVIEEQFAPLFVDFWREDGETGVDAEC